MYIPCAIFLLLIAVCLGTLNIVYYPTEVPGFNGCSLHFGSAGAVIKLRYQQYFIFISLHNVEDDFCFAAGCRFEVFGLM